MDGSYAVEMTPTKNKTQKIKQYLNHGINLKQTCKEYRTSINKKYPDPKKGAVAGGQTPQADESPAKKKGGKKEASQAPPVDTATREDSPMQEEVDSASEIDSVIFDDELEENEDYTCKLENMRNAPLPKEVQEYVEHENIQIANGKYISNLSAKKTGFNSMKQYKEFEMKK